MSERKPHDGKIMPRQQLSKHRDRQQDYRRHKRRDTMDWPTHLAECTRMWESQTRKKNWNRWGPYLSERQWGTVREDYSDDGSAWDYFPHSHAHLRAYRWGEDGLMGITDRECRLCFCLGLWNGIDPIIKERLFGLSGPQGNHGEDVKELYYYLDATPTSSYLKALYKYPHTEFPYEQLVAENAARGLHDLEFEIEDTGCFYDNYSDVVVEYCKREPNDILCRITVTNRSAHKQCLHVLPQVWLRNTWSWGSQDEAGTSHGSIRRSLSPSGDEVLNVHQETLGDVVVYFECDEEGSAPEMWFTENETNSEVLFNHPNRSFYTKDAFHRKLISEADDAVNPDNEGTKACAHYTLDLPPHGTTSVRTRIVLQDEDDITLRPDDKGRFPSNFDEIFQLRIMEADAFYHQRLHGLTEEHDLIQRQAYAGLLWSKQFYHYVVKTWLQGDPKQPSPSSARKYGRNSDWPHLFNRDIISMPDKWEYPWYATWDLAFHMVPMAVVDPFFAKNQLTLFLREWYMHPNGALPAYEWAFDDVNPPVHAWACWRVYKMTGSAGYRDLDFLERCFHKLMLNFTWWVNRKDPQGQHIFSGGFLGLDNIGLFDRSKPLKHGGNLVQADGTSWMLTRIFKAFFSVYMLGIALELAEHKSLVYEDIASKFFEHFVQISSAVNTFDGSGLWHESDGFYYDHLRFPTGETQVLKVRSMVGLIPLYACLTLEQRTLEKLPNFNKRFTWFMEHTPELADQILVAHDCDVTQPAVSTFAAVANLSPKGQSRHLLSIPTEKRLCRILKVLFDENEFLSPFGIRSLSKVYERPYTTSICGDQVSVEYSPAESTTTMFGGNSNWRGPIWFPVNYLIIEALDRYFYFYGENLKIEVPTGSGNLMNLRDAANEIARRLSRLFELNFFDHVAPYINPRLYFHIDCASFSLANVMASISSFGYVKNSFITQDEQRRPCNGPSPVYTADEKEKELMLFYEYFHPETGRGVGASHQTGWTALVARCLSRLSWAASLESNDAC